MKILTINTSCATGGAARVARTVHEELNLVDGVESIFVSGRDRVDGENIVELGVCKSKLLFNVLFYRFFSKEGVLNQGLWQTILDSYYNWADVIHLHNVHGYYLPENILLKLLKKPVLWTLHDYWLGTGRCAMPPDNCRGVESGCISCQYPRCYPSAWVDRASSGKDYRKDLISQSSALFVTPSKTAMNAMVSMGVPANRLRVIENPIVDLPSIDFDEHTKNGIRQALGVSTNRLVMIFVANRVDEPRKGFAVLWEALKCLPSSDKWLLLVVGEVSDLTKNKASPASVEVRFLGQVKKRQELFDYLACADCFVNPSFSETFGLVNFEALAVGSPVICSDLPVFREFDLGVFRFHKPGDSEELGRLLSEVAGSPPESENSMRLRIQSMCNRFSLENAVENYVDLYREIIS